MEVIYVDDVCQISKCVATSQASSACSSGLQRKRNLCENENDTKKKERKRKTNICKNRKILKLWI